MTSYGGQGYHLVLRRSVDVAVCLLQAVVAGAITICMRARCCEGTAFAAAPAAQGSLSDAPRRHGIGRPLRPMCYKTRSNFCAKAGLARTAEAFEAEWYELKATGRLGGLATSMPDVYMRNGVSCARLR
jgi:hypothetical protein